MNTESSRNSLVIILHEIYGVNDHINFFSHEIINEGFDVLTPNLLHRESFPYDQEEKAYQYFTNEIGFNKSLLDVKQLVKVNREKYDKIYIIGFSIGATIAWMSSEYEVDGIIGFYGSRIRNHVDIEPSCPNLLFFSKNEKSFNVLDLERKLKSKNKTVLNIIEAEHGFMNPFYKSYKPKEYRDCMENSIDFLNRIEEGAGIR
ncbi:dienelactone hydrolase family protein [Paenibacillus radicis (ex Xue et al. 2023)]|uniref:Dienelactone hydrolase family protein n=1 Tax=Paenibacillus radicis (ex Xue et al. 2023) TaxID=2972489 RepID=A0ABT1YB52_9BACL|nr:dienelactone hydrolase family protein [Paenibacillus radicis (ex Xue et al. 2023)]MCR8630132.1 dienelactone hydrolase family protein [Paenibacillus radicis (ex Xue et al. 2023)]